MPLLRAEQICNAVIRAGPLGSGGNGAVARSQKNNGRGTTEVQQQDVDVYALKSDAPPENAASL